MNYKQLLIGIACAASSLTATAQEVDYKVDMLGIGPVNILDTYISQEKYTGTEIRYISQSHRQWHKRPAWNSQTTLSVAFQDTKQRADNSNELGGLITAGYAIRYGWQLNDTWRIEAGGQVEGGLGFLYNTRNSNNPAQARAYLHIGPDVMSVWRFPLFRKQSFLRYELSAPLLGLMFSPNYGQSYYEIFSRGNYDHNIVPTTPICAPSLRQQLTLDFSLGKFTFRVGYLGDFQQAKVNSLKYHTYSHLLLVGLVLPLHR
jgi:hypothetical protein